MLIDSWPVGTELVASSWMLEGQRPAVDAPACDIPIARRLKAAVDAGFAGIGLNTADLASIFARHGRIGFATMIADYGIRHLEVETLMNWWTEDADGSLWRRTLDLFLDAASALPVRQIKINGDFSPDPPSIEAMEAGFAYLASRAFEAGTVIALEPVAFSNVRDPATAKQIVGASAGKGGGVMLDCWHFARGGLAADDLAALSGDAISGVEMSNVAAEIVGDLFEDTVDHRRMPDDGIFPIQSFLRAVAASGYRGPVGVEVLSAKLRAQPIEEALAQAAQAARRTFALCAAQPSSAS